MDLKIYRHDFGLTWTAQDAMARSAHALVHGESVWLIDPFHDAAVISEVRALGRPMAVLQLLDRHNRDCAAVARELGVDHMRLPAVVPNCPLDPLPLVWRKRWRELALWWPQREVLVVAEALGTAPVFTLQAGPVGVHPALRLAPPQRLRSFTPAHLLVGHGAPLDGADTTEAIARALDRSQRDLPRLLIKLPALLRDA